MSDEEPMSAGEILMPDFRYARVPDRLIRDRDLNDRAFRLWVLLARYGEQRAWPSRQRLAREMGSTTRAITNWLRELAARGYLRMQRRPGTTSILDLRPAWNHPHPVENPVENNADPGTAVPGGVEPPFHTHMNDTQLTKKPPLPPARRGEVVEVFEHWQTTLRPRAKLTRDRDRKVAARLREGYTVQDLRAAIDGCAASAFHREGHHTDLALICRDAPHVDRFIALAAASDEVAMATNGGSRPSPEAARSHLAALNAVREAAGQEPLTELPEEER